MNKTAPPPLPRCQPPVKKTVYPDLSYQDVLDIIRRHCAPVCADPLLFGAGCHHVVILPEAWEELKAMLHYGKRHPANILESQFQGLGHIFRHRDSTTVVVSHVLKIPSASCSFTHTTLIESPDDIPAFHAFDAEREHYRQYEARCNQYSGKLFDPFLPFGRSQLVVFGHTHPDLGCFFSSADHTVHRATEDFPAVSLVCDPIRKEFKAMIGVGRESAVIHICSYALHSPAPETTTVSGPFISRFRHLRQAVFDALGSIAGKHIPPSAEQAET